MKPLFAIAAGIMLAAAGCALAQSTVALPSSTTIVRDQLVVHSDFRLAQNHRLLEELTALRGDVAQLLQLPLSDESIYIYLFDSHEDYLAYVDAHFPGFPRRRAFFVETDTTLSVYAHWGDRVAEDLRHETSHGYLHAAARNLPLWLDEGLAEYFEVPRGRDGVNSPHVELLLQRIDAGWRPELRRLERFERAEELQQADYAESWAWAHWLLHSSSERRELLQNHLARLRVTGAAPPLSAALAGGQPDAAKDVMQHIRSLRSPAGK